MTIVSGPRDSTTKEIAPEPGGAKRPIRRIAKRLLMFALTTGIGFLLVFTAFLFGCQRRMIYFPRHYEPTYRLGLPKGSVELEFTTGAGRQTAFYLPPREGPGAAADAPPERLWVFFNGNASVALDWLDFVGESPNARAGFLLVDYPGYGRSEGKATRETIREASEGAFRALAAHWRVEPARAEQDMNVLGLSIGAATGLDFAVAHPVRRVVLIAPFTSLLDMARLSVGWPLCNILIDRFDNRARLAELAARPEPPVVHLFHGDADDVVPFRMGKELAASHPAMITFHPIHGADHNWIIDMAHHDIYDAME